MLGSYGCAMLSYFTSWENHCLPNKKDVEDGVIAYNTAAHAADSPKANVARNTGTRSSKARIISRVLN